MDFIKKYKNIGLTVLLIAVAAVVYTYFFKGDGINAPLLTSESPAEAQVVGEDILALLATLRSIRLDESIFEDPVFQSLEDFSQELVPEPVGRNNPFAPIGEEESGTTEEF